MNERIRKLAEQNGFIHEHMTDSERHDASKKFEKIAELIVRECASLAYDGPGGILDHFGLVEE
jgi:hypothetical protein